MPVWLNPPAAVIDVSPPSRRQRTRAILRDWQPPGKPSPSIVCGVSVEQEVADGSKEGGEGKASGSIQGKNDTIEVGWDLLGATLSLLTTCDVGKKKNVYHRLLLRAALQDWRKFNLISSFAPGPDQPKRRERTESSRSCDMGDKGVTFIASPNTDNVGKRRLDS